MLSDKDKKLIGGSDAPVLAGISHRKTPLDVWRRIIEGHESETTLAMRRGTLMEPVIRQMYQDETGAEILKPQAILGKPKPFYRANLDGIAIREKEKRVAEFKSGSIHVAHHWGSTPDDTPIDYQAQCQFYLGVTNLPRCDLVVLLGGDELKIYTLESDLEAQAMLFEACEKFWKDYILTKRPPPVDGSSSCSEWLTARFTGQEQSILAPTEAEEWARRFFAAKEALEKAETQKEEARNHLKEMCLSARRMRGQGWTLSWVEKKGALVTDWEALWKEIRGRFSANEQLAIWQRFTSEKTGASYVTIRESKKAMVAA